MASEERLQQDQPSDPVAEVRRRWRELWQIPAFAAAVAMLVIGLGYAMATKPDPNFKPILRDAQTLLDRAQYADTIKLLNAKILPYVGRPELPVSEQASFYQLLARAIYEGQQAMGIRNEENFRNALSSMRLAETNGADLTDEDKYLIADCYLGLGEIDSALARASQISSQKPELRMGVMRAIVARHINARQPRYKDAEDVLTQMLSAPVLPPDDRAWIIGKQAEIEIDQGFPEAAITRLLRAMPRMSDVSPLPRARLNLLLARAYLDSLATDQAALQLDLADKLIPEGDIEQAHSQLLRARVDEQREDYAAARDIYLSILDHFHPDEIRVEAEHGHALMEATLGQHESAQQVFGDLVAQVQADEPAAVAERDKILDSLLSIFRDQLAQQAPEVSFRYAELAGQLYPLDQAPPRVLDALAVAHRVQADHVVELAPKIDGPLGPELDPSTQREVQRLRIQAATFYRMHANAFVVSDIDTYANSLWMAATLYDQAGDQEDAADAFRQFAHDLPMDERQAEARYRLAQTLNARGRYNEAGEIFKAIIDDRDRGLTQAGLARYADLSHVPLAQVYLMDDDPANDDEAEMLLQRVLSGEIGGPESESYMPALISLSDLRLRRGQYARAIEGFEEAVARAEGKPSPELRFKLAESYRLNARSIDDQLRTSLTDSDRKLLTKTREDHLHKAMDAYESVRRDLAATHVQQRSALDNLYLRNSYFYLGDCAFDLGDTDGAVRYYNAAREQYPQDPASLVALVQIVNAYVREGNIPAARTANERARIFYESLPDEVWDDPNLPMSRRDWERWLQSSSTLYANGE